jgi:hypothetical protein
MAHLRPISWFAAGLVLAILWLLLRPQRAETPASVEPSPSAPAPAIEPPAIDAPPPAGTVAREAMPAPVRASAPSATRHVRVVRGDTGAPAGGATVWLLDAEPPSGSTDMEAVFRARGRELRADGEGIVALEGVVHGVFARAGALTGRLTAWELAKALAEAQLAGAQLADAQLAGAQGTPLDLRVYPAQAITIRTVDPNGAPCSGISVLAAFNIARAGKEARPEAKGSVRTGAAGEAIWRDFGIAAAECTALGSVESVRFTATVVGGDPISVELPGVPADGTVVELRLPELGRLTVRLLDPEGVPVPDTPGRSVRLRSARADGAKGDPFLGGWSAPRVDGRAVFDGVPLDTVFVVEGAGVEIAGPTARQREVEVDVRLAPGAYLRGRALDAAGKPLGERMMRLIFEGETEQALAMGQTAPDGRFLFWVVKAQQGATGSWLRCEIMVPEGDRRQLEARASVQQIPTAVLDLGDLRFAPAELLVSGQVLAAAGAPCTGYGVWVERLVGATWQRQITHFTAKGPDFSVFGGSAEGPLRLVVEPKASCHLTPEPVPFTAGQTDLRIQLERGYTLQLDVALPEGPGDLATNTCELHLVPTAGDALERAAPENAAGLRLPRGLRAGKSAWNGLLGGSYRLELRVAEAAEVLLARDVVLPDPAGDPPHVVLDLRDVLQVAGLRVFAPEGARPEVAAVELWYRGKCLPLFSTQGDATGRIALLVVPHAFDARVVARGYAPAWVRGVAGNHDVTLEPSSARVRVEAVLPERLPPHVELRVRATARADLPADWRTMRPMTGLFATLSVGRNRDPEALWPRTAEVVLDRERRGELTVHRAGPQDLALELVAHATAARSGEAARTAAIASFNPATCNVAAGESVPLRIEVPAAALTEALRAVE